MRNPWLIIIAGVSLAGLTPAAEKVVNLSGTWVLDPAKSESKHTTPEIRKINISTGGVFSGGAEDPAGRNVYDGHGSPEESPVGRMGNLTLLIVQTDGELQVTRKFTMDGEERTIPQKFALDGNQCFNPASDGRGGFVSRTNWQNNKLIHSGTETATIREQRTEISLTEEYSISKNGKKLTIKTKSATPCGVTTLKQVFHKLEEFKS